MEWGTSNDIKEMLDEGSKNYNLSYYNTEILIRIKNIDNLINDTNKYVQRRIVKDEDTGEFSMKFIGITRFDQLMSKIHKFIELYNRYSDSTKISLDDITGYKLMSILKFSSQDENILITDILRRMSILGVNYEVDTKEMYLELKIFDDNVRISFFKEPGDVPKSIFSFINSSSVEDYLSKLHTVASIMGVLSINPINMINHDKIVLVI